MENKKTNKMHLLTIFPVKECVLIVFLFPTFIFLLRCSSGTENVGSEKAEGSIDTTDFSQDDIVQEETVLTDIPTDVITDPSPPRCPQESYIWIANSAEGTLSKLCTITGEEMARYYTSPQEAVGDPSRTSVNLHGDMVVTNRNPQTGPSSVTKFAANIHDCIDRNGNGRIDTSMGPRDVKPWGEDECMIWNTPLPDASATRSIGARATAWDGTEDPETGEGGNVWIGSVDTQQFFKIDGNTGEILVSGSLGIGAYGGAVDGRGGFWVVAMGCTIGLCRIARLDMNTFQVTPYNVPCGYGISVDKWGRIWTAGLGCVNRFDPASQTSQTLNFPVSTHFNRGIAVDNNGYVWAAVTSGNVVQVTEDTVELVNDFHVGPADVVGVAVDFQNFIWAVSQGGNEAIKIDPVTYEVQEFPVGQGPYTYSDMTGFQLHNVIVI